MPKYGDSNKSFFQQNIFFLVNSLEIGKHTISFQNQQTHKYTNLQYKCKETVYVYASFWV